jgi:hypothetical protein
VKPTFKLFWQERHSLITVFLLSEKPIIKSPSLTNRVFSLWPMSVSFDIRLTTLQGLLTAPALTPTSKNHQSTVPEDHDFRRVTAQLVYRKAHHGFARYG